MPRKKRTLSAAPAELDVKAEGTSLDVEALRAIVEILESSEVNELSWRSGQERLIIRRGPHPAPAQYHSVSVPHTVTHAPPESRLVAASVTPTPLATPDGIATSVVGTKPSIAGTLVTSPFVGTFYRTPAPDQPSFVEPGSAVRKGQVICIIEAMKLMNEIESEVAGKVVDILAENGQPVEFGQPLFRIETSV